MRKKDFNQDPLTPAKSAIGVVQIVPDIGANIHQYDCLAQYLNTHGYIVIYGDEHKTFASGDDVFIKNVTRQIKTLNAAIKQYNLPVFMFGHGYGNFIVQRAMEKSNLCAGGACLTDGIQYPGWYLNLGYMIAWAGVKLRGTNAPAKCLARVSPICSSTCGINLSYGFYYSLFRNLRNMAHNIDCNTPLLIISGGADLVANNAKLSTALYRTYQSHNMENLTIIIYPGVLTKSNCPDIQRDILDFFNSILCPQSQG